MVDYEKYIVPGALVIGGYVVLDKLGFFPGGHDQTADTKVDQSKLPGDPSKYANIAGIQYEAMNSWGTDEDALFNSLQGLNTEELKAVYKAFGKRPSTISLIPGTAQSISAPRTIFEWYNAELGSSDLTKMGNIWKPTGLWTS